MSTIFSETLQALRRDAGFPTGYKFFHAIGGRAVLKTSYRQYLLYEQGKRLPPLDTLAMYVYAMHLELRSEQARRFILAWLRTSLGDINFSCLLEPLLRENIPDPFSSPLHKTVEKLLSDKKVQLTVAQMEAIAEDGNNYLCWTLLSNDSGRWTAKALAAAAGIPAAAAERSLGKLAAAKLLKFKRGAYHCPFTGRIIHFPHGSTVPDLYERLSKVRAEFIASGTLAFRRRNVLRAVHTELAGLFPLLSLSVSSADAHAITEKRKGSALFAVETRVVKVRAF